MRWLSLRHTRITDKGLVHLIGFSRLEWLSLSSTQVTEAGLTQLKGLTNLRHLGFAGRLRSGYRGRSLLDERYAE